MTEKSPLTECDVCNTKIPPDIAIYDKGMDYPEIAKNKTSNDDTVTLYIDCNEKLADQDIPNTSN